MQVRVGTSGYSYKGWKGSFYPENLPAKEMLRYYSGRLSTVEINNTFYRMPTEKLLQGWAEQVEPGFSFVLKVSRRITHQKKLNDVGEILSYLVGAVGLLGPDLGPLLFQLPPFFKKDVERLREFLAQLPEGLKAAMEFRNPSWFDDEVYDALRERNVAHVVSDTDKDKEEEGPPVVPTASYGYLRLRRTQYDRAALAAWATRVAAQPWQQAWVFFKHEDDGTGPRLAADFAEEMGSELH